MDIIYHCEKILFDKDYNNYDVIKTVGVHTKLFNSKMFAKSQDYDILIVECDKFGNANEDIEIVLNTIKNRVEYTMQDLRKYYKDLKERVTAEEYKEYAPKESKNIIELEIGNEEIIINKQNNTVISSFKNYNSVHDIVEELLTR